MARPVPLLALAITACLALMIGPSRALAQENPTNGGTLVVGATISPPTTLNSAVQSGAPTGLPSTQLFASPLRFDDDWNPQPYLAKSWHWSDDHKALTLNLRSNAVFHDGTPITSADVAFSIMAIKANHPFKTMFSAVQNVATPDPHTAVIKLSHPYPSLLIALSPALCPIMPKHIYDTGELKELKSNPRNVKNVVGSGPFKLQEYVPGKKIVLARFDKFFLKGRPHLDKVVIRYNSDSTALFLGLKQGTPQLVPFVDSPTVLRLAAKDLDVAVLGKGYEGIGPQMLLEFNTEKKPLDDKRVRQAIAYSLDKQALARIMFGAAGKVSVGPIFSASPYAVATHEYPVDLDKAKSLLDQAGLTADSQGVRFKTSIEVIPTQASQVMAEYIQAQLKKIGVIARLHDSSDFSSWASRVADKKFDMTTNYLWNWGSPVIGVARSYLSSNIRPIVWANDSSYRNPEVDQILKKAAEDPDLAERKKLYKRFQEIVTDDVPIAWLVEDPYHTLATQNVGNPPTSIWGPLSPLDKVYLKP